MFATRIVCGAALAAAVCAPSLAGVTVFDSRSMYELWGQMMGNVQMAAEDFSNAKPGVVQNSYVGKAGTEAQWMATADGGLQLAGNSLRTMQAGKSMTFNFGSGAVYGIGADFFYSTAVGTPVNGFVVLSLADGTNYVRSVNGLDTFAGFWSDGAAIAQLTITPVGTTGVNNFLGTDSMSIGFTPVPAPGALAVFAAGAYGGRRRRR